jgi:diguanylate cyclase (GGDEF)-like protein
MADVENWVEQQVKNKIKAYNRQRTVAAIPVGILIAILFLWPTIDYETLPIRLSVLCFALFLFCSLAFVLSGRSAFLLFCLATIITAVLLIFEREHFKLLLILILINAGTFLFSKKTASDFTKSAVNDIETINRLKIEATTDSLTHLLNRNGLEQTLETAWAFCKRDKKNVGFLLVDIDYFKSYNDTFGHLEGDNILKQVADSINTCFKRETDIISRFGGEEFLIFLSGIDDDHIVEMAQFLSSAITNLEIKATAENNPCDFLSVSIGVVTGVPQPHDLLIDFYICVDRALYHAKKCGRNCISFNGNIIKNFTRSSSGNTTDSVCTSGTLRTALICKDSGD